MGRIAVDVVLLPDEAMTTRAIEINRQLVTNAPPEIVLSREDRRPHISLAMGCIEESDVEAIRERLAHFARETNVRRLTIVGVLSSTNSRGETSSLLEVEKTEALQALHEQVMKEMALWFRYDVDEAMIEDDVVTGTTLDWIRMYPQKASYENFSPHITVGYGQVPPHLSFPIPFTVTRLAVCHLGNHCTCRRVLAAAELQT